MAARKSFSAPRKSFSGKAPRKQFPTSSAARRSAPAQGTRQNPTPELPPPGAPGFLLGIPWKSSLSQQASISCAFHTAPSSGEEESNTESEGEESNTESEEEEYKLITEDRHLPVKVIRTCETYADSVDAQTRQQLETIATREREKGTRACILDAEGVQRVGQGQHPNLEEVLESGRLHGCTVRGKLSTGQFAVYATQALPKATVLGSACGVLWTEKTWRAREAKAGDKMSSLRSTEIPAVYMGSLGYEGPDLVIDQVHYGNELLCVNDSSWGKRGADMDESAANCQAILVLDCAEGKWIPRVCVQTTRAVNRGDEIFIYWGDCCWERICSHNLVLQARHSRALHAVQQRLRTGATSTQFPTQFPQDDQTTSKTLFFDASSTGSYCTSVGAQEDDWLSDVQSNSVEVASKDWARDEPAEKLTPEEIQLMIGKHIRYKWVDPSSRAEKWETGKVMRHASHYKNATWLRVEFEAPPMVHGELARSAQRPRVCKQDTVMIDRKQRKRVWDIVEVDLLTGLPDSAFEASSAYGPSFSASSGQLDRPTYWCPAYDDQQAGTAYWQVDFGVQSEVRKIIMQGSTPIVEDRDYNYYAVEKFTLQISTDGIVWTTFEGRDGSNVFDGNQHRVVDNHTQHDVRKTIAIHIPSARFVRLYPLPTATRQGQQEPRCVALRVGFRGTTLTDTLSSLPSGTGSHDCQLFKPVTVEKAFRDAKCQFDERCNGVMHLNAKHRADLKKVRSHLILPQRHSNDPTGQWAKELKAMMRDGAREGPTVQVVEVEMPRHPARIFTVPDEIAHGVVAARSFEAHEPILLYSGELMPNNAAPDDSAYVYLINNEDLPGYPKHADLLCVDPFKKGNEARFINDRWAPPGMEHACANVGTKVLWDIERSMPRLVITAKRRIFEGEELLLDYGSTYWKYVLPRLMESHAQFAHKTMQDIRRLS
eukprot:COSAG01_NODE_1838_length_9083_cov_3.184328_8_plen_938_part_00